MTPQKGGYIVIDCTPLWIDNDGIDFESDGTVAGYATTDQKINKIIYNAIYNKKPIILNNLKIYDVSTESNYIYNGLVAHTREFDDGRTGGNSIDVFTRFLDLSLYCGIGSDGKYSLTIYGVVKQ